MGYAFTHGATAYTPDGPTMPASEAEAHNAALEAAELAEWATAPERFAAYIVERDGKRYAETWRGKPLGAVTSHYLIRSGWGRGMGYRMAVVRVRGNNGAEYHGRYGYDSGQLVRLRKVKAGRSR